MFDSLYDEPDGSIEFFKRLYFGSFMKPDEKFQKAFQAWLSYYDQLEEYQQSVCRLRTAKGIAIPQTTEEMRLSNQKARLLRQELVSLLGAISIERSTENAARQLALREHELKWERKQHLETTPAESKGVSSGHAQA